MRSSTATGRSPRHGRRGAAPPRLPHRLGRHVRLEHRHVDAERAARRVRATSSPTTPATSASSSSPSSARCSSSPRSAACSPTSLDRRKLLIWMQLEQLVFSVLLAVLAVGRPPEPDARSSSACSRIGIGNALSAPAIGAHPPDARPTRGPPGRGLAAVGADEPVARHRPGDRRRRSTRCSAIGTVFGDQRGHLHVRDRRPARRPLPRRRPRKPARRDRPRAGCSRASGSRPPTR